MKVAIVITSLEVGGAEKMVLDLIKQLKNEVEIRLFIIRKNYNTIYDKEAKISNMDITYINNKTRIFSIFSFIKLKRCLNNFNPNIIHTHLKSSSYIFLYRFFNKNFKWIHTIHTKASIDTKLLRRFIFKKVYQDKKIKLVAVSKIVEKSVYDLYKQVDMKVIYNGINLSKFKANITNKTNINICHVGRFVPVKNHQYLIYEFEKLVNKRPFVKLILVGDGPLKDKVFKLVKKLNLSKNVIFVGYTNDVSSYLKKSSIFVLPSIYEGMSLSMLEALSSGLIVVSSSNGQDIIEDGVNGYLIKLNKNELFNKLLYIVDHVNSLQNIKHNAIELSKEFSIENMARKYLEVYNEVVL